MKKPFAVFASSCMALSLIFSGCGGEEELQPKEVSYGEVIVDENAYENAYLGMGVKFPAEFEIQSAEDLGQDLERAKEVFKDTELSDEIENAVMYMDLQAVSNSNGDNVNIIYQELNKKDWTAYAQASDDEITDAILSQKDTLQKSYEDAGMEVISIEKGSLTMLGEEVPTIETKIEMYGMTMNIVQVAKFNLGGKFGLMITFTAVDEAGIQAMADAFYAL